LNIWWKLLKHALLGKLQMRFMKSEVSTEETC